MTNSTTMFGTIAKELYTAVLSDVLDELGYRDQAMPPSIRPLDDDLVMVGRARTGSYREVYSVVPGDNPYALEIALVEVHGSELDRQSVTEFDPLGLGADQPVGDLAEGAVPLAESGPHPVGELARQRAVGVVDTGQLDDPGGRLAIRGLARPYPLRPPLFDG